MWEHESLLTEEIKSAQRRGGGLAIQCNRYGMLLAT
jgi:hypothetical protein